MEDLIIPEITIPLGRLPAGKLGRKEDYFKIINDTYTTRYLEALGVGVTAKNRSVVERNAPLMDCEIEAAWGDHVSAVADRSAIAERLRVVQPRIVAKEPADQEMARPFGINAGDVSSTSLLREHFKYVSAVPPDLPECFGVPGAAEEGDRKNLKADALLHMQQHDLAASHGNDAALTAELERMRSRHRSSDIRAAASLPLDQDDHLRMEQELAVLKRQFVLPFACVRPAAAGSGVDSLIMSWQSPEVLAHPEADVPEELRAEALEPITATEAEIHAAAATFAHSRCPLELLTTRRDSEFLDMVRRQMVSTEVVRVTGLMAHLLYWIVFEHLHHPAKRLPGSSRQSLLVTIHDRWSALVAICRDLPTGSSFVLPVLALTIKRGVWDVFVARYAKICLLGSPLSQHLTDQINVLFMQLFDPDCTYARFGLLDQTREAALLWRKLDLAMVALGRGTATRMNTRKNRTTPVLNALLGLEGSRPGNAKTRRLLAGSASDPVLSRSKPPSDTRPQTEAWIQESVPRAQRPRPASTAKTMEPWKQAALYKVACQRLTSSGREALSRASSDDHCSSERPQRLNEETAQTRPPRFPSGRERSSSADRSRSNQFSEDSARTQPPRLPSGYQRSAHQRSSSAGSRRSISMSSVTRPVSASAKAR